MKLIMTTGRGLALPAWPPPEEQCRMCLVTVCPKVRSRETLSPARHPPVLVTSCPLVCEWPHTSRFVHAPE